jgi:hypothetical protein
VDSRKAEYLKAWTKLNRQGSAIIRSCSRLRIQRQLQLPESLLLFATGGLELRKPLRGLSQHDPLVILFELLPGLDFPLAATTP